MKNKKTRIVCTIGPAVESEEMLKKLIEAGMNVARLNTSHGNPETHELRINSIKKIRKEIGLPIATLLDLEGPKMRTGNFKEEEVELQDGEDFILTNEDIIGDSKKVGLTYKGLPEDVKENDIILVNDGKVKLKVINSDGKNIKTKIINGGIITHRRGINVPGVDIRLPALTEKDMMYIKKAVEWDVDYVAQSFVRKAEDVVLTKKVLTELGAPDIPVIVKIETIQSIDNLEKIIDEADGVMVARGDLGVEAPVEMIPILQKRIIELANSKSKPVITATQMLETMIDNPVPTRAEATDISNAILDGTDAVMLSAETSVGKYPIESVKVMSNVAIETEKYLSEFGSKLIYTIEQGEDRTTNAISKAAIETAVDINAKVIVATTYSGSTARAISRFRRNIDIIAASPRESTYNRMALVWGVIPIIVPRFTDTDTMLEMVSSKIKTLKYADSGDEIIVTASIPYGFPGKTNLLKIHKI